MKKLGIVTGTQAARDNGITTVSEKVLGSGSATNPNLRLTQKEEEYVLSQLIQRNFEKRRGNAAFRSTASRPDINGKKHVVPPLGLYEHKFKGAIIEKQKSAGKKASKTPDDPMAVND